MNKLIRILNENKMLWLGILVVLFITTVTVYAMLPAISLNSPTSFPVDI